MSDFEDFHNLLSRVRDGDPDAAKTLLERYEPDIRIIARARLRDPRLRRTVDSIDICQSIMANFFVRMNAGQFEFSSPDQLLKLLGEMVRNKIRDHARKQYADCRDVSRNLDSPAEELNPVQETDTPSMIAESRELLQQFSERLTPEEREVHRWRQQKYTWEEIAEKLGKSSDAIRKQFSRSVDRIAHDLGLPDVGRSE